MSSRSEGPIDSQLRQFIETNYSSIPKDEREKIIDGILSLMEMGRDRKQSLHNFLEQVARTVFRLFAFDEIAVGLYNRKENYYYYDVVFGYSAGLGAQYLKVRYDYNDMVSQERFAYIKTGKLSEFAPVEGMPEDEMELLNRRYAGSLARADVNEFHEGDYIDFWMYGPQNEILGWIEISRPRDGKLPPRNVVRWIEVIASVCALIMRQRELQESATGRS